MWCYCVAARCSSWLPACHWVRCWLRSATVFWTIGPPAAPRISLWSWIRLCWCISWLLLGLTMPWSSAAPASRCCLWLFIVFASVLFVIWLAMRVGFAYGRSIGWLPPAWYSMCECSATFVCTCGSSWHYLFIVPFLLFAVSAGCSHLTWALTLPLVDLLCAISCWLSSIASCIACWCS